MEGNRHCFEIMIHLPSWQGVKAGETAYQPNTQTLVQHSYIDDGDSKKDMISNHVILAMFIQVVKNKWQFVLLTLPFETGSKGGPFQSLIAKRFMSQHEPSAPLARKCQLY